MQCYRHVAELQDYTLAPHQKASSASESGIEGKDIWKDDAAKVLK